MIERAKTPSREDALAARLKSLREHGASPPSSTPSSNPPRAKERHAQSTSRQTSTNSEGDWARQEPADDAVDAVFETDDQTLEELLGDVDAAEEQRAPHEPRDEDVKALLEQLSQSIPKDDDTGAEERHSDDSDGEQMNQEVDEVMARFRDEAEVDAALGEDEPPHEDDEQQDQPTDETSDMLPSLPSNLDSLPSTSPSHPASTTLDDLTARMAALRAPATSDDILPSVPTSKPAGKPVKRLTSTTSYTDDAVDSWCTVCLEDATLRCLGCDDDPYCARCWHEMHVGPAAGFDERGHRAVQFTRSRKKEDKRKIVLGAS